MAGAHGRAKLLPPQSGNERERGNDWGPTVSFKGTSPMSTPY
jgi:hypothetical protein